MTKPINIAIFASRERVGELTKTISSAISTAPAKSVIDIVINGNTPLALKIKDTLTTSGNVKNHSIRAWSIPAADKANAWNQHIHLIGNKDMDCIYVDGYVQLKNDSISKLQETLTRNPTALGSSGAPTSGLSSKKIIAAMKVDGGFHGNLCIISAKALSQVRDMNIKLPLGMYRVDSLMGALLSFGLSNSNRKWQPKLNIPVSFESTWYCTEKKWYSIKDVRAWIKRRERQARGKIENAAIKQLLVHEGTRLQDIPRDVATLTRAWASITQASATKINYPKKAIKQLMSYTPPHPSELTPQKIYENPESF